MAIAETQSRTRSRWRLERGTIDWIALGLGVVLAIAALNVVRSQWMIDPQTLAYGSATAHSFGTVAGRAIHCSGAADSANCLAAYDAAGRPPAVLWLGNSQLAGINRPEAGDENAPQLLHRALAERGSYLVAYSQPNANLFEHAYAAAVLTGQYRAKLVVVPVVFDDLREQGVRDDVAALGSSADAITRLTEWRALGPVLNLLAPAAKDADAKVETADTVQAVVEARLNGWLESRSQLFADRTRLRGTIGAAIHVARNRILGIHSTSKRPVDPRVAAAKLEVLGFLLDDLRERGIEALVYVPPYRGDIDGPYIAAEYAAFKRDLADLVRSRRGRIADLEGIVPGAEWGTVHDRILATEEPDFMHFTAQGHRRLAESLDAELSKAGY